ncbi:putative membrane protein YfcA [Bacillus mesophilus]|uniref:Probable membrane transporter protein n=1 Tax=Bacillus mesophilus TaxID=1808955 RepID=A0A6M0Q226_9BACI|nr:sulfite exporter TauE/SafE family protein [Bacillus mesophilus]MBM7659549.1 putative membrane protein YfcA [Bacillus mesophilus]NEY70421.1 sulfite exporter TauE/SafE family protein [Bacillus mesophilus]
MEILLFIIIGFIGTFIGTLAGGGGLISLPCMLLLGVPIHSAIAANKFANTCSSFTSFLVLLKKRNIKLKTALVIAPVGIVGGISGGLIATSLSQETMMSVAIFLLIFALTLSFLKKPKQASQSGDHQVSKKVYPLLYGIGLYDGMFGPGQGTLQMYTYLYNGFSYMSAMALTRFLTFLSCLGAFSTYFLTGHLDWKVALSLVIGSILGAQLSVRVADKLSSNHLKLILRTITVLLIIQLSFNLVT